MPAIVRVQGNMSLTRGGLIFGMRWYFFIHMVQDKIPDVSSHAQICPDMSRYVQTFLVLAPHLCSAMTSQHSFHYFGWPLCRGKLKW